MSKRIVITVGVAVGLAALAAGGAVAWGALGDAGEPTLEQVTTLSAENSLSPPSGVSLTPPAPELESTVPISRTTRSPSRGRRRVLRGIRGRRRPHWPSSPGALPTSRNRSEYAAQVRFDQHVPVARR